MAEYIEKKSLIEWIRPYLHSGEAIQADMLIAGIKMMPAADVAPLVHGRWKYVFGDEFSETYKCSVCEHEFDICVELFREALPTYCPSCGAKMDGGEEDGL